MTFRSHDVSDDSWVMSHQMKDTWPSYNLKITKCCLVPFALNVNNWFDSEYFYGLMMTSYLWIISMSHFWKWAFGNILTWIRFGQWITLSISVMKNQWPHVTFSWPLGISWVHESSCDLIWTNENALKQDEKYCHLHTFERRSAIFVNLPSNGNGDRASKFWRFGFNFENGFHGQSKSFRMIHDFHAVLKLIFLTASNWFELVWTDCVKLHESKWMRLNVHEFSWISGNPDFLISGLNPWILGFLGFTHFRLEQH